MGNLEKRITNLERRVSRLETQGTPALGDVSRFPWGPVGDSISMSASPASWTSTATRFSERLTSLEFARATLLQAAEVGASCTVAGGFAAWWFSLPWYSPLVIGAAGGACCLAVLVLANRLHLKRLVDAQARRDQKKRSELRVEMASPEEGYHANLLYLRGDVEPKQLKEFARAVLDGTNLGVHTWTGGGACFTRGQYSSLMSELVATGFGVEARGNVGRQMTAKGRALMRGLADM